MKTIEINGWEVTILDERYDNFDEEGMEDLMDNHLYNLNTNWEQYRKTGNLWKRKKRK